MSRWDGLQVSLIDCQYTIYADEKSKMADNALCCYGVSSRSGMFGLNKKHKRPFHFRKRALLLEEKYNNEVILTYFLILTTALHRIVLYLHSDIFDTHKKSCRLRIKRAFIFLNLYNAYMNKGHLRNKHLFGKLLTVFRHMTGLYKHLWEAGFPTRLP